MWFLSSNGVRMLALDAVAAFEGNVQAGDNAPH